MNPQALTNTPSAAGPAHHIDRGHPRYSHGEDFDTAVISVSTGNTGDSEKQHALSEARGYVLRKYIVDTFPMDDTHLKTLAMGKKPQLVRRAPSRS